MFGDKSTTTNEYTFSPLDLLQDVQAGVIVVDKERQLLFVNHWLTDCHILTISNKQYIIYYNSIT